MTVVSSLLVYTAQQTTESKIDLTTRQMLRDELAGEALQISTRTAASLHTIEQTLSASSLAIAGLGPESDSATQTLLLTSSALAPYTDNIVWISADGALVYTTSDEMSDRVGSDLSNRSFYEIPLATGRAVMTYSLAGVDGTPSFVVAVPIPLSAANDRFNGSLAAIVPLNMFAKAFLSSQVHEDQKIMAVTNDGTILVHSVPSLAGKKVSDREVMQLVSVQTRDVAESNFELMVQGRSGILEYRDLNDEETIMAYEPVDVEGVHVLSVAVFQLTSFVSEPFIEVFAERQNFTIISSGLVATISAIFIGFILVLNRRLFHTVSKQDKKIVDQLSELQNAYNRLKEQDVIKDEFINIAAHELRTPVLPIVLSAENLADSVPENENVKIILRNANRITKLTNDILDVSRIESNTFKLQKQKVNIRKLAEEVITDARFKMPADQKVELALESSVASDMEELLVDRSRINQVLVNLVDNAVNFTEEGTIKVSMSPGGDNLVKVSVIDQGKGIDPVIKEKLFGKFVSKSDRAKGTGLGLYLSKSIIEAHGGTMTGENNVGSKGATFSFTLPVS